MLIPETLDSKLKRFEEAGLITTSERNLRSKLDSILRSIENLQQKKERIEFELKKQKASLIRKRQELTRSHKSLTNRKVSVSEGSESDSSIVLSETFKELRRLDSITLQISDRVLDQD